MATLAAWRDAGDPLGTIAVRFEVWMREVGRAEHDATGLAAERNVFRYRPLPGGVAVRTAVALGDRERSIVELAARVTGCRVVWSSAVDEPADVFAARLVGLGVDRLRLLGADGDDDAVRRAAHAAGIAVDDAPPVGAAEVELPRWLREQSVTTTIHRHGRLSRGERRGG